MGPFLAPSPLVRREWSRPIRRGRFLSEMGLQLMSDQTYDEGRARNLEALLVTLAQRILELQEQGALLGHAGELTRLLGEVRSELFHYEVRATYDTPEVADSRRIVAQAKNSESGDWGPTEWKPDEEEEEGA
jgi:hypothetical protein